MYGSASNEFLAAIRGSGKRVITADLYYGGTLIRSNLPVTGGNVSSDSAADIRRNAHITVIDPDRIDGDQSDSGRPTGMTSSNPLTIYGTEVVLKSGIEFGSGNQEFVPLGVFVIWTADRSEERGDIVELELYDRAKLLAHGEIPKFYDASGQSGRVAIQNLVNAGMPMPETVTFDSSLTDVTLPGGTTYDSTYLDAIMDIAESMGAEFYFDLEGHPICAPKPSIDSTTLEASAVFTADCGPDGVNTSIGRQTTREDVFNGIGVYGVTPDDSTAQPYAEAYDLNTSSPTYYNGAFGKAFKRIDRPELTSPAQCQAAAQAELEAILGRSRGLSLSMLPNPTLEPGDLILVGFYDDSTELHLIESIDFDFAEQSFSVTTKGRLE